MKELGMLRHCNCPAKNSPLEEARNFEFPVSVFIMNV